MVGVVIVVIVHVDNNPGYQIARRACVGGVLTTKLNNESQLTFSTKPGFFIISLSMVKNNLGITMTRL